MSSAASASAVGGAGVGASGGGSSELLPSRAGDHGARASSRVSRLRRLGKGGDVGVPLERMGSGAGAGGRGAVDSRVEAPRVARAAAIRASPLLSFKSGDRDCRKSGDAMGGGLGVRGRISLTM